MSTITVVLVGNPNVGKTSILNYLVGANLKIGNWAGVTVEKKEGYTRFQDYEIHFIDLPGVYTLDETTSEDERITYEFLINGKYDVILNIIETPRIERDLYLTCQLLDLRKPMVIALNMIDEAKALGIEVDTKRLSELLNLKVVETVGRTGKGVKNLLPVIVETYEEKNIPVGINYPSRVEELLATDPQKEVKTRFELLVKLEKLDHEIDRIVREKRLSFARGIAKEVTKKKLLVKENITEILDQIFLHPVFGFVCFLGIMYFFFKISFDFSGPLIDWLDKFFHDFLSSVFYVILKKLDAPEFLISFLIDGIIGGVGTVISFIPLIFMMYLGLTILETTGYLPRVSFLFDRFTHKIGLHGQSVIPLMLGLGCNVPAILATRTFQEKKDKLLVMAMIPFISCPARLVVFSFFSFLFFTYPALVILVLYLVGIFFSILTGFLLRKFLFKKELSHFVMDLPPYRVPSFKTVFRIVKEYVKEFIYRAGTIIFGVSIILWILLNTPIGEKDINKSYAAKIGKTLSYIFAPIGLGDWKITTSLFSGMLARENIISNLSIILAQEKETFPERISIKEKTEEVMVTLKEALEKAIISMINPFPSSFSYEKEDSSFVREKIQKQFDKKEILSFLTFILIYNSCIPTVVSMAKEGSWKFSFLFLLYSFILGWFLSFIVYQVF